MKIHTALIVLASFAFLVSSKSLDGPQEIQPTFVASRDTRFLLQTRQNRLNPFQLQFQNMDSILQSHFNASVPTRVLIHGWQEDQTADISTETSAELLDFYNFNVIFIDWSVGSQTINYIGAANRVEPVGQFVAQQLNWMRDQGLITFDRLHVIGFSLGAHVAGFVGKNTGRSIDTIIGLDPAGPLFSVGNPNGRIDAGDARYVECLHTNGGLLSAGIGAHICQADFFPNGGSSQPGCLTNTCSHLRAVTFYVESIQNNGFHSTRCATEREASRNNCNGGGGQWFGGEPSNAQVRLQGIFHFFTNRNQPFAQGPVRP